MSSDVVIKVENLSKQYRLGIIGTGTLSHDLNRWWAGIRGKEDPYLKIGSENNITNNKSKSGYVWALKDLNFEVKKGEVLGIIGKNGAGKSTLLKILSRVTTPSLGEVKIKGRISSLLEVGTGFHPELTGKENIFLNGAILGMTKKEIRSKFDEIVSFSGVEKYIDTPVKRYSSGMYVRLAFAVAAHLEPEILIVDEVLAVGDVEFQKKCLGKMKDVSGQGRTVLFVSHQMEAIESLCTRCLLLQNGTIVEDDFSHVVVKKYLSNALKNAQVVKLGERTDRSGSGNYRYDDVFFTNDQGDVVKQVQSGFPIVINLIIKKRDSGGLPINAMCGVGVHDDKGRRLFSLSNVLIGENVIIKEDTIRILWRIDDVQLYPGEYKCNVFLAEGNGAGIIDWVVDAFVINIIPSDYFHTGKVNAVQQDLFFVKHSLTVLQ